MPEAHLQKRSMPFHFVPLARDSRAESSPTLCVHIYTLLARLSTPKSSQAERFPRHAGVRAGLGLDLVDDLVPRQSGPWAGSLNLQSPPRK